MNCRKMLSRFAGSARIGRLSRCNTCAGHAFTCKNPLARSPALPRLHPVPLTLRIMALLLAALWLPQTMHCQLAHMGFTSERSSCCDDHCCSNGDCDCQSAVCKSIEAGHFDLTKSTVAVPVEVYGWVRTSETADLRPCLKPEPGMPEATGAPPGLPGIWQFVFRAAPAPRAPSLAC